jgi:hypothetical protein
MRGEARRSRSCVGRFRGSHSDLLGYYAVSCTVSCLLSYTHDTENGLDLKVSTLLGESGNSYTVPYSIECS